MACARLGDLAIFGALNRCHFRKFGLMYKEKMTFKWYLFIRFSFDRPETLQIYEEYQDMFGLCSNWRSAMFEF